MSCDIPSCDVGTDEEAYLYIEELDGDFVLCPVCYYAFKIGFEAGEVKDD
jgi:hypothetical protein